MINLIVYFLLLQFSQTIYLVKNNLHTGIVIQLNPEVMKLIPAAERFEGNKYIDIGWGDEDFYQHPDPDYLLGAKAILVPTNSVVRIQGKDFKIDKIVEWSDFTIQFNLNGNQFKKLCEFINLSFLKDENENFIIASEDHNNKVVFYKSGFKYHLFNTCNTWIAEAFEKAGFNVSSSNVVTAENLFEELSKHGGFKTRIQQ